MQLSQIVNQDQALGAARGLISFGGGYAVGHGWITADQVTLFSGIAAAVIPLVWTYFAHTDAAKVKAAAVPGVEIVVQSNASDAVKEVADDPAQPTIVRQ